MTQRRCAESRTKGFKDKIDSFIPPDRATRNFRGPNPDLAAAVGAFWGVVEGAGEEGPSREP